MAGRQRQKQLMDLRAIVEGTPEKLRRLDRTYRSVRYDAAYYRSSKTSIPREERLAFGEELMDALKDNALRGEERTFDTYQGFQVILPAGMLPEKPYVYLRTVAGGSYPVDMDGDKLLGFSMRLDRTLDDLPKRVRELEDQMQEARLQCKEARADMDQGNPYQKTIVNLTARLAQIDRELEEEKESSS